MPPLRSHDFRRFWLGSFAASLGLWVQTTALGWLVFDLTRSAGWLGTVSFCGNLPTLVLGLLSGAIADRASRRAIMTGSLLVFALGAFVLAALTAAGHVSVAWVIVITMVVGAANTLYTPAMQSVVPSLVAPADLLAAISLNSVQFNAARAVGPAVAGFLYAPIGPAGCFALNGCACLGMAIVVTRLGLPPRPSHAPLPIVRALRDGIRYARRHPVIGPAIFLAAVMSLFGFPYIILLPAVARDVLGLDARGLGWLMACVGTGAVGGGLALSRGSVGGGGQRAVAGAVAFGVVLTAFAAVRTTATTMVLLALLGACQTVAIASLMTTIQTLVDDGMRGRVMSMMTVVFFGFSTLGGLVAGVIGDRLGVPRVLASGGVVTALVALVLARSRVFA